MRPLLRPGSFADYRITKLDDSTYRVVDTHAGRGGADILKNIEKLNFADVSAVDITLPNPMPVKDVITIADSSGLKLIKASDLLANDRDWQGDALHITTISDIVGGTLAGTLSVQSEFISIQLESRWYRTRVRMQSGNDSMWRKAA